MVWSFLLILYAKAVAWTVMAEKNVAYGKVCNQSSYSVVHLVYSSHYTVDGTNATCFISKKSGYQWIYVDLLWKCNVQQVTLFGINTTDYLRVFLTNVENIQSETYLNITCFLVANGSYPSGKMAQFNCSNGAWNAMRYVFVVQSNESSSQLVICELEASGVWAEINARRINVLYKKPADNYNNGTSMTNTSKAVDGMLDPHYEHGFCYISKGVKEPNLWLKVDMQENYFIDYVAVTNTNQFYDFKRMSNFTIGFSENDFTSLDYGQYPFCARYPGDVKAAARVTLQCNANLPAYRFFIIHQALSKLEGGFTVCEVEAYAALNKNSKIWKLMAKNKRLSLTPTVELVHSTAVQCSVYCSYYNCDSFSFNRQQMLCQINKHINGYVLEDLQDSLDWTFWTSVYADF